MMMIPWTIRQKRDKFFKMAPKVAFGKIGFTDIQDTRAMCTSQLMCDYLSPEQKRSPLLDEIILLPPHAMDFFPKFGRKKEIWRRWKRFHQLDRLVFWAVGAPIKSIQWDDVTQFSLPVNFVNFQIYGPDRRKPLQLSAPHMYPLNQWTGDSWTSQPRKKRERWGIQIHCE